MALISLKAKEATTTPLIAEKIYDQYWLSSLSIGGSPSKYKAVIRLDKYKAGEVLKGEGEVIVIDDIFSDQLIIDIPEATDIFNGLLLLVKRLGQAKGIIEPDDSESSVSSSSSE